jgi:acylglycerol lipase
MPRYTSLRYAVTRSILALMLLTNTACSPLVNHPGGHVAPPHLKTAHFVTADRTVLPVRSWLPKDGKVRAAIVALHGFNDYSNFFTEPGKYLSRQGIACYAYDQRGFGNAPRRGLWSGVEAYTSDLTDFTNAVRRHHPGVPVYVLGESMGSAVAIVAMTGENPPDADGVILVAPAVWGRETMPWYQRWLLAATSHTVPWLQLTGRGLHILPSDNIEMLRGLSRDPLVIKATRIDAMHGLADLMDEALARADKVRRSTLVLYGEHDEVVPKEPVFRMLARMSRDPRIRAAFYEHGYHLLLRDLHAEQPWGDIAAWIANRDAPLPSGADRRVPGYLSAPVTASVPVPQGDGV